MKRREIPWMRLTAEGALIVVSILLAFWIDAWWDERQEAQEKLEILVSLRYEFEAHRSVLARAEEAWGERARSMERLLQSARSSDAPPPAVMDTLLRHLTWAGTWDPGSGARDALIASGRLELIDNLGLRNQLAAWQGVVDEVRDNEAVSRQIITEQLNPYLARSGVIPRVKSVSHEWPAPVMSDAEADQAYRTLLADTEFEGLVASRYAALDPDGYSRGIAFVDSVLQVVEAELQRY